MNKKILSVILSVVMLFSCFGVFAFAQEEATVCETAADVMNYVIVDQGYSIPVRIVPARLELDGETCDIYLIGMLGVKSVPGQVNSVNNLFAAAFNQDNSYSRFVKDIIFETIPEGSALVFAGHSLGGMVAQHLRTDSDLQESYEILNVLTAGSPLILVNEAKAEGSLSRLADKFDVIPFLSPATVLCFAKQIRSAHREDGGYFFDPDGAHNLSYIRNDVWGGYDAFGVPGGNAKISYNPSEVITYGAANN